MSAIRERPPAVAGKFYPANPDQLQAELAHFLSGREMAAAPDGDAGEASTHSVKAIVAPHAGYIFSGPIAGTAYARLKAALGDRAKAIERVILIGPAHFVAVRGMATSSFDEFRSPLGRIPLDREAIAEILKLPQVGESDAAHAPDHALEVHLPFLQTCLGEGFRLVPLLVGDASAAEVAEVLELLWGGDETLIVISSDLSHFHDYATASEKDRRTAQAICNLDAEAIAPDQACGRLPIQGMIACARKRGLRCRLLDLRNSGDTAGSHDRVVGYGAFSFES